MTKNNYSPFMGVNHFTPCALLEDAQKNGASALQEHLRLLAHSGNKAINCSRCIDNASPRETTTDSE